MNQHIRYFLRSCKRQPAMHAATLAVLAGTYTIMCLSLLVYQNLESVLTQWGESVQVSAYLKEGLSESEIAGIQEEIKKMKEIANVNFVSKDEAANNFLKQMSGYSREVLFDPDSGSPLPASFEVSLPASVSAGVTEKILSGLKEKLLQLKGIDDVNYGQGWVENYSALVSSFKHSSWVLMLVLLSGSIFVVGNQIRNATAQRKEEIEVLELVGATSSSIRFPFILEGTVMSLGAAVVSLFVCAIIFNWQVSLVSENLGFWTLGAQVNSLSIANIFTVLFISLLIGAGGSYLCVRKASSGWAAAERLGIES